jgi:hypothetical protein
MVNYVYVLPLIEQNNQQYLLDGRITLIEPLSSTTKWANDEARFSHTTIGVQSEGGVSKL